MGHQKSRNQSKTSNYPSGDNSGGQTYLSLLPRVISSGIIKLFNPDSFRKIGAGAAVFSTAFLIALLTSSSFAPVQNSSADTIYTEIDEAGTFVNVSSPDYVGADLKPRTSEGDTVVVSQTVTTTTNSDTGYRLFISATSKSNEYSRYLLKDGVSSGISNGTNSAFLAPSAGIITNPMALTTNTWGYALTTTTGNNGTVTENSNFIGLPFLGQEHLINNIQTAVTDTSANSAKTTVYFGMKANTTRPSGTYYTHVVYTAVAEAAGHEIGISVSPYAIPKLTTSSSDVLMIATPIVASAGIGIGTGSEAPTVTLSKDGTSYSCTNISRLETGSDYVSLSCELPSVTEVGQYDIEVSMPRFSATPYTLAKGVQYYVPWEKLQYMQDMTAYACDQVETPTAFENGASTPTFAYGPLTQPGTDEVVADSRVIHDSTIQNHLADYWSGREEDYSTVSYLSYGFIENTNKNVPERELLDVRDGTRYRIRKLADGNCWMTENLQLAFSDDNGTIGYVSDTSIVVNPKAAATYNRTINGETYGPSITIPASHKVDENYSNVGKNATGGSSASRWSTSNFNAGGTAEGSVAYTELMRDGDYAGQNTWGNSQWNAGTSNAPSATSKHNNNTAHSTYATQAHSTYYARSVSVGETYNNCVTPGAINNNYNYHPSRTDCFIRDGDAQEVGVYYNFTAATAGTILAGDYEQGMETADSICPAGWQLPSHRGSKSWANLIYDTYGTLTALGITDNSGIYANLDARNNNDASDTRSPGYYKTLEGYHVWALSNQIRMAPISLAAAGFYGFTDEGSSEEGVWIRATALAWSSSLMSAERVYVVYSTPGAPMTQATYNNAKSSGFNIRCVNQ